MKQDEEATIAIGSRIRRGRRRLRPAMQAPEKQEARRLAAPGFQDH